MVEVPQIDMVEFSQNFVFIGNFPTMDYAKLVTAC